MSEKKHRFSRRAAFLCAAVMAVSGMQASAGELTVQTEETTESEGTSQKSEFSVTLQDIVDANNGIEKVLGSHARVGCTEIQYDENGNQTDTSQYAITRDGDSYVLSYVEKNGILTYKNGSAWLRYTDGVNKGQKIVQPVDPEKYAQIMEWVETYAPVEYSETEEITAEEEKDGKLYIQSQDPEHDDSTDGKTACFYYVLDKETLQAEQIMESLRDENGKETMILKVTMAYGD